MSSIRLRRLSLVSLGALLGLMLIGPSSALAKPPGWAINAFATPPKVVNGTDSGFDVTVANNGKSNISAVFVITDHLDGDPLAEPSYVSGAVWTGQVGPANPCSVVDGRLFCEFGNIISKAKVEFTVAFPTPDAGTSYAFKFLGFGNGNTPSDGGTSHGDFVEGQASVNLTTDKNFAGKFSLGLDPIFDDGDLGPKNIQASSLTPPQANLGVSLEDGLGTNAFPCPTSIAQCATKFGEWTRLYVDNGADFPNGIKVVTTILGNKVPNQATIETIDLIKVNDAGVTYVITNRCDNPLGGLDPDGGDADALGDECIIVREVGNNFQVEAWLLENGGARFGY